MIRLHHQDQTLALVIPAQFHQPGATFFTPTDYSQQLAYMAHPAGHAIKAHYHKPIHREVLQTQEVLFIKKGRLRVDFYDGGQTYLFSHILECGDTILLVSGGHGFKVLEELEMIEVKQGPFKGTEDKCLIPAVAEEQIRFIP